jgi:hypothetical protein
VDARVGLVRVVLDIVLQSFCGRVGGEYSAVAGVVVEGVAVDGVWGLGRCEEEDGARICRGERCVG